MINIVLVEPRIPQNTGNIGRICLCANARMHLIYPIGFTLDSKMIKRSGMDYFNKVDLMEWESLEAFLYKNPINEKHYFFSTKAKKLYFEASYESDCFLYFGREDRGLPFFLLENYANQTYKIPLFNNARSLNISNTASIITYEVIKQNFNSLETKIQEN